MAVEDLFDDLGDLVFATFLLGWEAKKHAGDNPPFDILKQIAMGEFTVIEGRPDTTQDRQTALREAHREIAKRLLECGGFSDPPTSQ